MKIVLPLKNLVLEQMSHAFFLTILEFILHTSKFSLKFETNFEHVFC
jgi:hypothetical protein